MIESIAFVYGRMAIINLSDDGRGSRVSWVSAQEETRRREVGLQAR